MVTDYNGTDASLCNKLEPTPRDYTTNFPKKLISSIMRESPIKENSSVTSQFKKMNARGIHIWIHIGTSGLNK